MTAETLKNLPGDIRKSVFECAPLERPSDRTPPTAFFYSPSASMNKIEFGKKISSRLSWMAMRCQRQRAEFAWTNDYAG
jgi:hypothetical protein